MKFASCDDDLKVKNKGEGQAFRRSILATLDVVPFSLDNMQNVSPLAVGILWTLHLFPDPCLGSI